MFDGNLESLIASAGLPTTMRLRLSSMAPGLAAGQALGQTLGQTRGQAPGRAQEISLCTIIAVDYSARAVDLAFDRRTVSAAHVLWAARELGEVRDVSLIEAGMEETVKWLLVQ